MSDKKTKHTAGPWFHSDTSMWGCVTTQAGGHGHVVAEVNSPPTGAGSLDPARIETTKANARLIAAAPDLRDAVEAAIDEFAIGTFNAARRQRVVEFLRKSLARAEGRS